MPDNEYLLLLGSLVALLGFLLLEHRFACVKNGFMVRSLAKSPAVLLALGFWILACAASLAEDADPIALNQQEYQLVEQGKYKEAIPIAEKVVEIEIRSQGLESLATADALSILGLLWNRVGDYA